MIRTILAASTLALGLATSAAMAQSVSDRSDMTGPASSMDQVDTGTTGSIYSGPSGSMTGTSGSVTTGTIGPCASAPGTLGPDANAGPNVNDQYCGK